MVTNMVYGNNKALEEEPTEGYTEEEEAMDLAALAEVVCRRCNKKEQLPEIVGHHLGVQSDWKVQRKRNQICKLLQR